MDFYKGFETIYERSNQEKEPTNMAGISTKLPSTSPAPAVATVASTSAIAKRVVVAEIVRMGDKLVMPSGMTHVEAAEIHMRAFQEEEQTTDFYENITEALPPEGAVALVRVLERTRGVVLSTPTEIKTFFGVEKQDPQLISVDVGPGETVQVPWGTRLIVPGIEGFIQPGSVDHDGGQIFTIHATVKRKHQLDVKKLADDVREEVKRNSIYRGRAIKVRFHDEAGELLPLPQMRFMDLSGVKERDLVFSHQITRKIEANLFGMIEPDKARLFESGKVKRRFSMLVVGEPGVGKTLLATVTALKAVKNGVTFFYGESAAEYPMLVKLATRYDKAVVFEEDIDRIMTGNRTAELDKVLNIMDGIDTKSTRIITVLTSNHPENIPEVARRKGRVDLIVKIPFPDAEAAERIIRNSAGEFLKSGETLTEVGEILAGQKPSDIFEAVERAKKYHAYYAPTGTAHIVLTAQDLKDGALEIVEESKLFAGEKKKAKTLTAEFGYAVGEALQRGISSGLSELTVRGQVSPSQLLTEQ